MMVVVVDEYSSHGYKIHALSGLRKYGAHNEDNYRKSKIDN